MNKCPLFNEHIGDLDFTLGLTKREQPIVGSCGHSKMMVEETSRCYKFNKGEGQLPHICRARIAKYDKENKED
jgi:hypothetical protein